MKLREAAHLVRAASSTRVLAGKRVRLVHGVYPAAALVLLMILGGLLMGSVWTSMPARIGAFLVILGALVIWGTWTQLAVRRNNDAYGALLEGDLAAAERGYVAVLSSPCPDAWGVYALANLGHIALLRGELEDARALLAAAWEVARKRGVLHLGVEAATPGVCAGWALALACEGKLEEAEQVLARVDARNASAGALGLVVRSRALVALGLGRAEEAIALIDGEQALLRNTLGADDTALVQAIVASALGKTGGTFRGTTRAAGPVPVDHESRQYVLRMLPGAASFLTEA
jgi:hypothetical protein